jgi:hypothetical protein
MRHPVISLKIMRVVNKPMDHICQGKHKDLCRYRLSL